MATNWKSVVEKINAETFVLPDGWDSRDHIATELDISPDRVDDALRPGLKSGRFIKQPFKVWDDGQKRNVQVIAYHDTTLDKKNAAPVDVEKLAALRASGKSYPEIGKTIGKSGDAVRSILKRAGK